MVKWEKNGHPESRPVGVPFSMSLPEAATRETGLHQAAILYTILNHGEADNLCRNERANAVQA
ncbi:MAG: hypothetical protein JRJ12_09260 [Deltaproteobacteria bacterium]|nr:hypothetical protein [Deltaproteobacteria bacterium]